MTKTYVEEVKKVKVVDSTICNKCGKTDDGGFVDMSGFEVLFGYGSKRDGDCIKFDLCSECVEELINSFKIPAELINPERSEVYSTDAE